MSIPFGKAVSVDLFGSPLHYFRFFWASKFPVRNLLYFFLVGFPSLCDLCSFFLHLSRIFSCVFSDITMIYHRVLSGVSVGVPCAFCISMNMISLSLWKSSMILLKIWFLPLTCDYSPSSIIGRFCLSLASYISSTFLFCG